MKIPISQERIAQRAKEKLVRIMKEVTESSGDLQINHTPPEICEMMLDKVDLEKAKSVMVLFNVELVYELTRREYKGDIYYFTQSLKECDFVKELCPDVIIKYIDKKENPLLFMETWPEKFDIIVSNPPYGNGGNWKLHIDFLDKSLDLCSGEIVFVHPSNQFILPIGIKNKYIDRINNKIGHKLSSVCLFNGNQIFNIKKHFPLSITHIKMNKTSDEFVVDNLIMRNTKALKSIHVVNLFNEYKFIDSIRKKVKDRMSSSMESKLRKNRGNTDITSITGRFFVSIDSLIGSTDDTGIDKMWKPNFFTFVAKNKKPESTESLETKMPAYRFEFETETEAENFIEYSKTFFARFCLSLLKTDKNMQYKMWLVPEMDFTQEWTDEKLYAHFGITEEEQAFIKEIIPPYYE